jgi:hypothetical protein
MRRQPERRLTEREQKGALFQFCNATPSGGPFAMQADSAAIAGIDYDETHEKLFVRFDSGEAHMYVGVPPEVHRSFAQTDGKDRFFREEVSGCYPYNQLPN